MKYLILFLCIPFLGQAQGIDFFHGSFAEAKQKAAAEKKLIFIDAYTTWCGPCKKMAKDVFPQESVGKYFNAQFVNMKIDMEKGEGPELAQKYAVNAYPTYLFLDANGEVVHKALGYIPAGEFVQAATDATDPNKQSSRLDKQYEAGERSPEFLKKYMLACSNAMSPRTNEVAEAYLATQKDWLSQENMDIIMKYVEDVTSKPFQHLLSNVKEYEKFTKPRQLQELILGRVANQAMKLVEQNNGEIGPEVEKLFKATLPAETVDSQLDLFSMEIYSYKEDWDNYAKTAVKYVANAKEVSAEQLNLFAYTFYEYISDKKLLEKAKDWSHKSVELDASYYNIETLAALYYKLGDKKKASKYCKQSIKVAEKAGLEHEEANVLLKSINEM